MNRLRQKLLWLKAELRYRLTGKKYEVVFTDNFKKQLEEMPKEDREEVLKAIEMLRKNPYVGKRIYEGEKGYSEEKECD
jgi:mRNA-degrading endonuclease RelE of RelBE toxin-antitoxin system